MNPSYNNPAFGAGSGGQPQQPVFGASGVQTPVGSGAGDIVLAPEKKSHKGVIIALILAVLIIGGLFIVMFLIPRGSGSVNVSDATKLAFNKYANYLLYGEDSDKALEGEYDESNIYKLDEIRSEDAKGVTNYFKTANELLTNFESLMSGNTNNDLVTVINNYRADFELVRLTFNKEYINEEELASEVMNNDLDTVKAWIASKYNSLTKSSYDNIKQYAEAEINYYQLYAEYLEEAKSSGCLNAGEGVTCADYGNEILESQIVEASDEANDMVLNADHNVLKNCWNISGLINGEVKDEK